MTAATAAGLAVRYVIAAWRASDPDAEFTERLRAMVRPSSHTTPEESPTGPDTAPETASLVDAAPNSAKSAT